jgi:hypothetical protein
MVGRFGIAATAIASMVMARVHAIQALIPNLANFQVVPV